mgnify:CR=1 FL=1
MDRGFVIARKSRAGIPHTRGDGPLAQNTPQRAHRYSPHAWGWTEPLDLTVGGQLVFPTRVGMDRLGRTGSVVRSCIPHTRGDGP